MYDPNGGRGDTTSQDVDLKGGGGVLSTLKNRNARKLSIFYCVIVIGHYHGKPLICGAVQIQVREKNLYAN